MTVEYSYGPVGTYSVHVSGERDTHPGEKYYFRNFVEVPSTISAPVLDRLILKTGGFRVFYGFNPKLGEVFEFMKHGPLRGFDMTKINGKGVTKLFQGSFFTKSFIVDGKEYPVTEKIDLDPEAMNKEAEKWRGLL
jgi:hypothetical protein